MIAFDRMEAIVGVDAFEMAEQLVDDAERAN
jgi:hypothetical protein